MTKCAECGRAVVKTVPVMLGRVPFGRGCARRLGLVQPRGPSPPKVTLRPMDLAPHEPLEGQLALIEL